MAEIKFFAFVEKWKKDSDERHPNWMMKTCEVHSKANADGTRETTGRSYRTIKVARSTGIDLSTFSPNDLVYVEGNEVTEERDGYKNVIVWASAVSNAKKNSSPQANVRAIGGVEVGSEPF